MNNLMSIRKCLKYCPIRYQQVINNFDTNVHDHCFLNKYCKNLQP